MSSTAFIEPLPVIEFVSQLLNREISSRPLSDADRVKVQFFALHLQVIIMKAVGCYVPFKVTSQEGSLFLMFTWRVILFLIDMKLDVLVNSSPFLWFLHNLSFLLYFLPLKIRTSIGSLKFLIWFLNLKIFFPIKVIWDYPVIG